MPSDARGETISIITKHVDLYLRERVARGELARGSVKGVRYVLTDFARFAPPEPSRINRRTVERWMANDNWAPAYRRRRLSVLRVFCEWLVLRNVLRRDPTLGLRPPKQPRSAPRAVPRLEIGALISICESSRDRLTVFLMVQEGMRCKEVVGLQTGDLDWAMRTARVVGKGGHERTLPLSDQTWAALSAYLDEYPAPAGVLLRSLRVRDAGLSAGYVSNRLSELFWLAGVKKAPRDGRSAHALRHTMATDMLIGGANLVDVQAALGHASILTTRRYLPNNVRPLREAMSGRQYGSNYGGTYEDVERAYSAEGPAAEAEAAAATAVYDERPEPATRIALPIGRKTAAS